jgi:hypothetical protein
MRFRTVLPGLGLLVLAAILFWAAGCSDEKSPINNNNPINYGSLTDPDFIMVQDQVNNYLDSSVDYFSAGLGNISKLPSDTGKIRVQYGPMSPEDTVAYTYLNGWHIVYVSRSNLFFTDRFMDSVQFMNNSDPIQNPNGLDYMHYIHHWNFANRDTTVTHTNLSGGIDLEFSGLDGNIATINGTKNLLAEWVYFSNDTTLKAFHDMDVQVNGVTVQKSANYGWASGCPTGGSVNMDINQSYIINVGAGPNLHVKTWQVTVTFNDGVAAVIAVSAGQVWNYTRTICTPPSS